MPNLPKKHHYLPQFLLRAWTGVDGKLERFIMPHERTVHARSAYPSEVGFEVALYASPPGGNPAFDAERDAFQKLDNAAAQAHARLLRCEAPPTHDRVAWSCFLMSLFHRTPQHLPATKTMLGSIWDGIDDVQKKYEDLRREDDPPTVQEFLTRENPFARDHAAFRNIISSLGRSPVAGYISRISWTVIDTSAARFGLLLSDNPIMLAPLGKPMGHIAMPIAHDRLFVAAPDVATLASLKRMTLNRVVRASNKAVVEHAWKLVVAADRSQRAFIEARMARDTLGSLASGFAEPVY